MPGENFYYIDTLQELETEKGFLVPKAQILVLFCFVIVERKNEKSEKVSASKIFKPRNFLKQGQKQQFPIFKPKYKPNIS